MKKLLWLLLLVPLIGCQGVMNEFDRDAARAHSEAQKAVALAVLKAQGDNPICSIEFEEGVPIKGLKRIACFTPPTLGGLPEMKQYNQPEHPAKALAAGAGSFLSRADTLLLGGWAFSSMASVANNAAGTVTNTTISGTGNQVVGATTSYVYGSGNLTTGMLNATAPAQVVIPPVYFVPINP